MANKKGGKNVKDAYKKKTKKKRSLTVRSESGRDMVTESIPTE